VGLENINKIRFTVTGKLTPALVLERYSILLFQQIKQKLSKAPTYVNTIAIVAYEEEQEIGLLVVGIIQGLPAADLISIYVKETCRGKKLGTGLLKVLEQALSKLNIQQINAVYQSDWEGIPIMEKMLQSMQWQTPEKKFDLYKVNLQKTGQDKGWIVVRTLPEEIKIVLWSTLGTEEKNKQAALCTLLELSPFQMEEHIAFNSQAAYIKGEPAGYLITHKIKEGIQYTSLFVKPCFQQGVIATHMINNAGAMQYEKDIYNVVLMVDTHNTAMGLYLKRFLRLLSYQQALYTCYKKLKVK
jgi:GNAT superfamily N-acetyltransferase